MPFTGVTDFVTNMVLKFKYLYVIATANFSHKLLKTIFMMKLMKKNVPTTKIRTNVALVISITIALFCINITNVAHAIAKQGKNKSDNFVRVVVNFESSIKLNASEKLDNRTATSTNITPWCGVKEKFGKRQKRFNANRLGKWRNLTVTYRITKYARYMRKSDVDSVISEAFEIWERGTNFTFQQTSSGSVNIEIRFETGVHLDLGNIESEDFSLSSSVLAHASFPTDKLKQESVVHFNDYVMWNNLLLLATAVHEFGHSLGLQHSDVTTSVMFPTNKDYIGNIKLDEVDISGIYELYYSDIESRNKMIIHYAKSIQRGHRFQEYDSSYNSDLYLSIVRVAYSNNLKNFRSVMNFIQDSNSWPNRIFGLKTLLKMMARNGHIYSHSQIFTVAHIVHDYLKIAESEWFRELNEIKHKIPQLVQTFIWNRTLSIDLKCCKSHLDSSWDGEPFFNSIKDAWTEWSQEWRVKAALGGKFSTLQNGLTDRFLSSNSFTDNVTTTYSNGNEMQFWNIILYKDYDDQDFICILNAKGDGCLMANKLNSQSFAQIVLVPVRGKRCSKFVVK